MEGRKYLFLSSWFLFASNSLNKVPHDTSYFNSVSETRIASTQSTESTIFLWLQKLWKTHTHTHFLCLWLVSKVIDSPPLPYPFSMMKNCTKWMVQMRLWWPKLVIYTHLMWITPPFSRPASTSLMPSQVCLHALFLSLLHNHFYHYDAHFLVFFCLSFGPFWYLYLVSCFFLFNFTL